MTCNLSDLTKRGSVLSLALALLACQTPLSPKSLDTDAMRALLPKVNYSEQMCADYDALTGRDLTPDAAGYLAAARGVCNLPTRDVTLALARQHLTGRDIAYSIDGDTFTLFQRGPADDPEVIKMMGNSLGPATCCSIQSVVWRQFAGTDLWVARLRFRNLDAAVIRQQTSRSEAATLTNSFEYRGPNAPSLPPKVAAIEGHIERVSVASPQLGEVRRVVIYLPANVATLKDLPVVLTEGGNVSGYAPIVEALVKAGKIRPIMIAGVVQGNDGIDGPPRKVPAYKTRVQDTDPQAEGCTAVHHIAFVGDTLRPYLLARYPISPLRDDWVITGASMGGTMAVNFALLRPDVFGHAWPMSIGGGAPADLTPFTATPLRANYRISAGYYELGFLQNSRHAANGITALGGSVTTRWFSDGHNADQWEIALADNLMAVFPVMVAR